MTTFVKYHNFIADDAIGVLQEKFRHYFDESEFKRTENIVEVLPPSVAEDDVLQKLNQKIIQKCTEFCGDDIRLDKLWMVHSTPKICDLNELPYLPHFDKKRYVKGFLYLSDVNENSGPLTVCKKQLPNVDQRRRNMPPNYFQLKSNVENSREYKSEMNKICGKSGTLIIFDTNTLHQAGIVKDGYERKVLRFDFENPLWNKTTTMEKIRKRLNNLLVKSR